jgi:hypothetical protein
MTETHSMYPQLTLHFIAFLYVFDPSGSTFGRHLLNPSVVLHCMVHVGECEWKQYMPWLDESVLTMFFIKGSRLNCNGYMTQVKLMQIIQNVRHGNRHFKNEKNI